MQATLGPCTAPKPWGWNVIENAKHTAWKQLGDMPVRERASAAALDLVSPIGRRPAPRDTAARTGPRRTARGHSAPDGASYPPALARSRLTPPP